MYGLQLESHPNDQLRRLASICRDSSLLRHHGHSAQARPPARRTRPRGRTQRGSDQRVIRETQVPQSKSNRTAGSPWPDIGHADRPWATIVGVVGDVKQMSLAVSVSDAFYTTTTQWAWVDTAQSLVVRTHGDAAALAPAIRKAIWSVDKDQPIVRAATMDTLLATSAGRTPFCADRVRGLRYRGVSTRSRGHLRRPLRQRHRANA